MAPGTNPPQLPASIRSQASPGQLIARSSAAKRCLRPEIAPTDNNGLAQFCYVPVRKKSAWVSTIEGPARFPHFPAAPPEIPKRRYLNDFCRRENLSGSAIYMLYPT